MRSLEELRTLAHGIIDAYELRVKTVGALMKQTHELLRAYQVELEEMMSKLEDNLAKGQCLRRKDFNAMIGGIIIRRREMEKETGETLKNFWEEEEQMIKRLRNIVTKTNASGLEEISFIKEDILTRQKEREGNLVKMLRDLQMEQEELGVGLKKLLSKEKEVKIKDFKLMIKALKFQQRQRENEIVKILDEFEMVREKVSTEWQRVTSL